MASATNKQLIKTAKIVGRRELHFRSMDDIRAEAQRLATVPVTMLGNWTLGQMFQHLANGLNTAIDGANISAPLPIRILARIFRGFVINRRMSPGVTLPRKAASVLVPGDTGTQAGLTELLKALERWQSESTRHPHFAFGKLSSQQWDKLQLRHAEMHLSLAVPSATRS